MAGSTEYRLAHRKGKKMILIVDDDEVLSMHAKKSLESAGRFDVKVVHSAIDGLEVIFKERPEAVLLDILMPVCDGITLLGMIRQSETLKDLPVIMYSSENSVDIVKRIAKYKPNGYVIKPVESRLIADVIDCAVGKRESTVQVNLDSLLSKLY